MTGCLTLFCNLHNGGGMEATELVDKLFERFGSHRKVAEMLLMNEVSYYKVRTGRAKPSKRLVQAMKNLLAQAGV